MIGDTHRMLKRIRRETPYEVREGRDSEGNLLWNIHSLNYNHDPNGEGSEPQREYLGNVTSKNPRPFLRLCFGRPYFFARGSEDDASEETKRVTKIAGKNSVFYE